MQYNKNTKLPCPNNFSLRKSLLIYILATNFICLTVSIVLALLNQGEYFFFLLCFIILTIWATVVSQLVAPKDATGFIQAIGRKNNHD